MKKRIVLNDLYDYGLKIYQIEDNFKFSLDSILLAEAVTLKKNDKVLDLCTGNGSIPLILSTKYNNSICGMEIQKEVCDLAQKSIDYNNLSNQIRIVNDNVINTQQYFPGNSFDVITCNPPYFKYNPTSYINDNNMKALSRHEITVNLHQIINVCSCMLNETGIIYLVHRSNRMQEIMVELHNLGFAVKNCYVIKTGNEKNECVIFKAQKNSKEDMKLKILDVSNSKTYQNIFR